MIAIYTRQSVEKKDSLSLDTQKDICLKYLGNITEDYKVYEDSGWSGKNLQRPSMQELIKDIKAGSISKVVSYRIDRIARSVLDFNNLLVLFNKYNVEYCSATENIDTCTPTGRAMLNIISTFSELERETIRERVKTTYWKRVQEGAFSGGKLILGFDSTKTVINGKSIPILTTNDDIKIVKDMFNYYNNNNISLRNTAIYINNKYNTKYDSSMISKYLRNPVYAISNPDVYNYYKSKGYIIYNEIEEYNGNGLYIIGKRNPDKSYNPVNKQTILVGLHKGIIPANEFLQVQYKLSNNKQLKRTGKSKYTWITNIYCMKCKTKMAILTNRLDVSYLNCRQRMRNQSCPGLETTKVQNIEHSLLPKIQERLNILSTEKITKYDENMKTLDTFKIQLSKIDNEIEIYKSKILLANDVVMELINTEINKLVDKRNNILGEMNKIKITEEVSLEGLIKDKPFKSLSFEDKKEIFQLLIDRIYLSDQEIEIIWKI